MCMVVINVGKNWLVSETIFSVVRADEDSIYCKHSTSKAGLVLVKTKMYILISLYIPPMFPAVCVEATEKLGSYLRTKGL